MTDLQMLFDIQGQTAVITGGSGHFGRAMARALARAGARIAILGRNLESAQRVASAIQAEGGITLAVACDVMSRASLEQSQQHILSAFGQVDILINAAGGNSPAATTSAGRSFFDLDTDAINNVFGLNCTGTIQSCQVFGRGMAERGQGCIVNVASMSALRPLTRIPAYSAAKAAIANFTQWLAVYIAQEYSSQIRVKTHPRI